MKKIYSIKVPLLLMLLFASLGVKAQQTATFDAAVAQDNAVVKDGYTVPGSPIEFKFEKGKAGTAPGVYTTGGVTHVRVYQNGGMLTVSAPEGYSINQIVFTVASNLFSFSSDVGEINSLTWSGDANKIVFTTSSTVRTYVATAKVTYTAPANVVASPTISPDGGTFINNTTVTIAGEDGVSIYYTTDGTVPTVSSKPYTEPFVLKESATVKAIAVKGEVVSEVTSSDFTIITTEGDGTFGNPYTAEDVIKLGNPGTKAWVKGTVLGFYTSGKVDTKAAITSNLALGTGTEAGQYIPVQLTSKTNVREAAALLKGAEVYVYGTLEAYLSNKGVKSTSELYVADGLSIGEHGIASYYGASFELPEGVEAGIIAAVGEGVAAVNWTAITERVPANTGVLLRGAASTKYGKRFTNTRSKSDVSGNMLKGTTIDTEVTSTGYVYKLSDGDDGFGFYWGVEGGKSLANKAGKAYLEVSAAEGATTQSFRIDLSPTAIASATATNTAAPTADTKVFDLSGRNVGTYATFSTLPKGIYIVAGKKVIK